jgi:hypothetical protein
MDDRVEAWPDRNALTAMLASVVLYVPEARELTDVETDVAVMDVGSVELYAPE